MPTFTAAKPTICAGIWPQVSGTAQSSLLVQANVDKTKGKLEELGAKLQHEQAKLSTYNADLKAYKDRYDAAPALAGQHQLATDQRFALMAGGEPCRAEFMSS